MSFMQPPVPQFPPNPTVGQVFLNWVWNGSQWVCRTAGPVCQTKVFTTSQTYFPAPGLTVAIVEAWGGGGGGGGAQLAATGAAVGGGGGGSGGRSHSVLSAALLLNG